MSQRSANRPSAAPRETAWTAMSGHPLRFLRSSWPWRSLAYLLTGPLVAMSGMVAVGLTIGFGVMLGDAVGATGILTLPLVVAAFALAAIPLAAVERRRLRWVDPLPAPSPHRPLPGANPLVWLRVRFREAATWREVGHAVLSCGALYWLTGALAALTLLTVVPLVFAPLLYPVWSGQRYWFVAGGLLVHNPYDAAVAVAFGLPLTAVSAYVLTALAAGSASITRALIAPREAELAEQVSELESSRARIVGAFDAERRRIERDLHDGAQQRLTSLVMTLGLARLELDGAAVAGNGTAAAGTTEAGRLVAKAHEEAKATVVELRELIHGIHPQVLTDRGLGAAVEMLAERSAVPVVVDVDLPERPPEGIEASAYFVVSEALANVVKHSNASRAEVHARRFGELLTVEVRDDGVGGADVAAGTGLAGLSDRVAVLDGKLALTSPTGGPTVLRVELPCGS